MKRLLPTPHQKLIAKKLTEEIVSEERGFSDYWDEKNEQSVILFHSLNSPQQGVDTYSTVGLSSFPLMREGKETSVRTEIIGACGADFKKFDSIIATAAFCVINSGWFCAPGVIFPNIVSMYDASETLTDLYFCPPFLWEGRLSGLTIAEKKIAWLLAVPIARAEANFASHFGPAELEILFQKFDIDIFDLNRESVI